MFKKWSIEDIKEVLNEAVAITGVGIEDIDIRISSKRTRRNFGLCGYRYTWNGIETTYIQISYWLANGYYDEDTVRDTILHEYAHHYCNTVYNKPTHHNKLWKEAATLVGATPSRFCEVYKCDREQLNKDRDGNRNEEYVRKYPQKPPKYAAVCEHCGTTYHYHRMRSIEEYEEGYRCGMCGGNLKVEVLR